MWDDLGEVPLTSLELFGGILLLWFVWSIGSDVRNIFRLRK